jgi:hypothetical protein
MTLRSLVDNNVLTLFSEYADDWERIFPRKVGTNLFSYKASQTRKTRYESSQPRKPHILKDIIT